LTGQYQKGWSGNNMAMITLSLNGKVLREMAFIKERIAIGRGPGNDLVLDNLAVSAEHAVIVTVDNDSFLEDLNSTNGTQVNGQPIKKHFLQDGDIIEIAHYRIRYQAEALNKLPQSGVAAAKVTVIDGLGVGKEIVLAKALTTLGKPGVQVAAIARREDRYYLLHVEGNIPPAINGCVIGNVPHGIVHGDMIDISGTRMKFTIDPT
jgi:hypothetical protein